jgi:MFS family permease
MSGLLHSFYAIGLVATVLIMLGVLAAGWAWRSAFLLLAAMIVPYGLLILVLPLPAHAHEGDQRMPARQVARRGAFWLLVGAIFMSGVTELGPGGWLPAFVRQSAQEGHSAPTTQPALAARAGQAGPAEATSRPAVQAQAEQEPRVVGALGLLAFGVSMAVGRLTVSAVIQRLGVRRLFVIGGALCAVSLAMASLSRESIGSVSWLAFLPLGPIWSASWLALLGLGVAGFWPTILATAGDRFPRAGASMFALLSATGNLGGVVGPVTIGLVADRGDLYLAMRLMALVPVAALVLVWFAVRRGHEVGQQGD